MVYPVEISMSLYFNSLRKTHTSVYFANEFNDLGRSVCHRCFLLPRLRLLRLGRRAGKVGDVMADSVIRGAPAEARWLRPEPRRALPATVLEKIVRMALPGREVIDVQPLGDGLRNANFKIELGPTPEHVVLRLYEHDASLAGKEADILHLIRHSVPVPEVLHAEPDGMSDVPPFLLLRYVEGITFRDLKRKGNTMCTSRAAHAVGETLASIGRISFPKPGWLAPGPSVKAPLLEGKDRAPRFVDLCLASANAQARMEAALRHQVSELGWSYAAELGSVGDATCLVHGDFGGRNVLVRQSGENWKVAAVLDWEFAVAGSPLADIGHFLRYERVSRPKVEPHFSNGYLQAGGTLPHGWRRLARVIDLTALCESLTHDDLPDDVVRELVELVRATVENRDPD